MHFLPQGFEDTADYYGWSPAQRAWLITLIYAGVAEYCVLLLMSVRNMYVVLVQY